MEHDERNMLNFNDGQKINMTIPERIGKFLSCIGKLFWGGGQRERGREGGLYPSLRMSTIQSLVSVSCLRNMTS